MSETVRVEYEARLLDGQLIDQNNSFEFTLGEEAVIPGFERVVSEMKVGETRTVQVNCEEAYGNRDNDLVQIIARDRIPVHLNLQKGMHLQIGEENDPVIVTIVDVNDSEVVIDANHPLAGQSLQFKITKLSSI
ncbi:MAG: FKBP-type peptidyl-prolyl cis-trans isomerase [Simkaniaceae bacterium]|nr:FKBP-type peptidyl-prolyl cis-trans isomerase [Simkaniaceae bacterium]